ncbi:MAG: PIG-L family deacetylase [Opitutaceae bacterium]
MVIRPIILGILATLLASRIGPRRAKTATRTLAVRLCRWFLTCLSRPYRLRTGPCIVFAPHQDDETLGCGALIARKRSEGLPVQVVFITDGRASHSRHPVASTGEMGAIRRREAFAALAILGVESCGIHFLDEPDGALPNLAAPQQAALVARLAQLIMEVCPEEIFLPCSPDGSSEHDAAFGFISAALARTPLRPDVWQYPVWSWWNPGLLVQRLIFNQGYCRQAAEDYQLIKTRALARYRSQLEPLPPWREPALPPDLVRNCNSGQEFFFRFLLPPPDADSAGDPVI